MDIYRRIQREIYTEPHKRGVRANYRKLANKKPLSKAQEQEILDYWQKLIGYKIPLDWHRYFYSRTGLYAKEYIPTSVYRYDLIGRLNQLPYCVPYSDKNMMDVILSDAKQPHIYLKNRNGYFYFENNPVSFEDALKLGANMGDVIIKPTLSSHGNGVKLLHVENGIVDAKGTGLKDLLLKYKKNFLVQDAVKQHPAMARLNPDSINTLRIVTFRSGMDVVVCYVAIRIGRKGQVIDNESAGGISTKVNKDGSLSKYAFGSPGQDFIEETDYGVKLEGYMVPSFDKTLNMVKAQHLNLPLQDLIGWDVCIDENGDPVLLEWNSTPELSQSAVGPALGEYTELIVKEAMKRPNSRMGNPTYRMPEPVTLKTIFERCIKGIK